ncbi:MULTISPECIES: NEL-type E3 ubiquitin ligase domain-containing protein [unclassified Pseudomonas]|uniref:NEL-type E3 ubiquitin ligase domain-containing protein n=1 Tax=unclassified Pseudomonas TaxID=196821 RepID=UPI000C88A401|nr:MULTISPECIES: NEL-type E3 ubiquitin ligase domain-containing protein [unclassified Pseudomonas]PMZ95634.1 hypothetical protein C1X79_13660 [Pseudomonas sp. FW305-42]PNA24071.1 hypothetical protein C1X78_12450 [Pseudomonas sp. MPR-R1B]PNB24725.1 hypothetical protein C1X80_16485 [Pseudomonas sp. DP16D-E2]PNB42144.1 hypothetical protein C1X75_17275 [Pseudomonas sp. FW305-17]PNB58780.1 hypothetical protein C1X77_17545 [Pseudomonas sp. GW531-E2]
MNQHHQTPSTAIQARGVNPTDDFIASRLPDWLARASRGQIRALRDRFARHRESQERLRQATLELIPLQQFAKEKNAPLLPAALNIDQLQWREVVLRNTSRFPNLQMPQIELGERVQPALLRLMQNFHEGADFWTGTGLVDAGTNQLVYDRLDTLVHAVRQLDAGQQYQALLDRVLGAARQELVQDKRDGLALATEIAALKGQVSPHEQIVLRALAKGEEAHGSNLHGYAGALKVLDQTIVDAVVIVLRDVDGQDAGVILYLPSDPERALRSFASRKALSDELVRQLRQKAYRQSFSRLVSLKERAEFLSTLELRLKDDETDLQVEGYTLSSNIFDEVVAQQIERVKADARLLLVPTAQASQLAAQRRLDTWKSVGLGLFNLAGFFIPEVGALLLGQFVVQTLAQVYEGAMDWHHGHQHEALNHMLGVAENVAVGAVVGVGAGLVRSAFVDELVPVSVQGEHRLWHDDLEVYAVLRDEESLQEDGLYGVGEHRLMRDGGRFYQVHREGPSRSWRLRHPLREGGYGPVVEHNGERSWMLRQEHPLQWNDSSRMLNSLWALATPFDANQAEQILLCSGIDQDELRGLLVEGRRVPFNLRDTLQRFEAHARIGTFFAHLQRDALSPEEGALLQWCRTRAGLTGQGTALRSMLLREAPTLRRQMFAYLTQSDVPDDPLLLLVSRDFPGLPDLYAREVVSQVSDAQRSIATRTQRLPLALASRARTLLRLASLNRAVEGLYLPEAYHDNSGHLLLASLRTLPEWPRDVDLELRDGAVDGRIIAQVFPEVTGTRRFRLLHQQGAFSLYDSLGEPVPLGMGRNADVFDAIMGVLTEDHRQALGSLSREQLRQRLLEHLPFSREGLADLLELPHAAGWVNPGHRLADGRVGYLLSGRAGSGSSPRQRMLDRLRGIYPGLDEQQLEPEYERLLRLEGPIFQHLANLEDDAEQLNVHLNRWVDAELNPARQVIRERFAMQMRRAWRLQGEPIQAVAGQPAGQRLSLINLRVTTLPQLPAQVDFSRITVLTLAEGTLTGVHEEFLHCFTALRELNLSSNRLLQVPRGLAYLIELRRLRLAHNNIRLDRIGLDALNGLPNLTHLDLSYNPLGAYHFRYNQLSHLVELNLRHTRLIEWPSGIELCEGLERVDLRDNELATVPPEILAMPNVFRRAFLVRGNNLRRRDIHGLYALDLIQEHHHLPQARRLVDPVQTRAAWIACADEAVRNARATQWDALQVMPGSEGLFTLLGHLLHTADYSNARAVLEQRVWRLLGALQGNSDLRNRVHGLAALELSCENSVADRFSDLLIQQVIDAAERNTAQARGDELLALGRGLFRLEEVEWFARRDIMARIAVDNDVDQIATALYYRVQLRQRLSLPEQPHSMLYADAAAVDVDQIEAAFQTVRVAESPMGLAESLSHRLFWQRYLRERHRPVFDAFDQVYATRRSLLQSRQAQLSALEYSQLLDSLEIDRASDEHAQMLQLTREFLMGRERGRG